MRTTMMSLLGAALLLGACAGDVSEGKVEAEVKSVPEEPAKEAPAEPAQAASGEAWAVDAAASKIGALGAKITNTHDIAFPSFEGSVMVADGAVTAVKFSVDMNALVADAEKLTGHLKSPDFFDVAANPTSTFESTAVTAGAEGEGFTHTITGKLTMAGKTNEVTFPAKVELADGKVTANTEFAINRQDWGITYPGKPDDLIQDKVVLTVSLVANKG